MRMAFFHDNVMLSGEQGEQYSIIFPYSLWKERYLPCFEEISVSTRVKPMSSVPEDKRGGFVKSSGERVVMRPVTAYRSMADALFHRGAIRAQVVLELENKLSREIITGYEHVTVTADPENPTVCLVEFSFTVAHGLNQIWLTASITI